MTRPIAALRSPTLMDILANVALWLQVDYPAMPEAPPLTPPTGDIQAPRPLSRRFRLLYPQQRTFGLGQIQAPANSRQV